MSFISTLKTVTRPLRRALLTLPAKTGIARTPENGWFKVPSDFHPLDYWGLWTGKYEKAESQILAENFQSDDMIIEIGANIGVVSRITAETKLKPHGTLICVEANPKSLPFLDANLIRSRENHHDVRIVGAAVGAPDIEGETQTFCQRRNLSSGLNQVLKPQKGEVMIGVPVVSLSSLVGEFVKADRGYSLICDAEGAEILILQRDPHALDNCRQIAIELHHPKLTGSDVTPEDMVEQLESLGFAHKRVLHDTHYFARPSL